MVLRECMPLACTDTFYVLFRDAFLLDHQHAGRHDVTCKPAIQLRGVRVLLTANIRERHSLHLPPFAVARSLNCWRKKKRLWKGQYLISLRKRPIFCDAKTSVLAKKSEEQAQKVPNDGASTTTTTTTTTLYFTP